MKIYNFITQENHHVNSHDGGNYSIVCEYQNTRSGFRHVATLLKKQLRNRQAKSLLSQSNVGALYI